MSWRNTFSGICLVGSLVVPAGLGADEPPAFRADLNYASRYVFRGVERAGSSMQAGANLTWANLSGGVWVNQPLAGGEVREANLNAACAWKPVDAIGLELSLSHSWFDRVPGNGVSRSAEAGLTATFPMIADFAPSLAYHRDFRFGADTIQGSLARSVPLTSLGAFLELNIFAGAAQGDDWRPDAPGPRRRDGYSFWGGEARVPYRVGPHSMVTAGLHYTEASGRSPGNGPFGSAARRNLWVTLGVNLDF